MSAIKRKNERTIHNDAPSDVVDHGGVEHVANVIEAIHDLRDGHNLRCR